ncbi:uncharacterized protein VP01_5026g1, partial [Puccinia sorghi]
TRAQCSDTKCMSASAVCEFIKINKPLLLHWLDRAITFQHLSNGKKKRQMPLVDQGEGSCGQNGGQRINRFAGRPLIEAAKSQPIGKRSSFFDHNHRHRAKVALRNLRKTGTELAYTQDLNQHTHTVGWADTPLMSLYQHGLKENIQLVMSNVDFDSLRSMQAMALKAGQKIEGI